MTPGAFPEGPRPRLWLLVAITIILTGWALRATGSITVPVVLSFFLALLVAPLDRGVASRAPAKLRWLGHVAAMGTIVVVLLTSAGLIWMAARQVVARFPFPTDGGDLLSRFDLTDPDSQAGRSADIASDGASASPPQGLANHFGEVFQGAGAPLAERAGEWASGLAMQVLGAAGAMLLALALIFFLTLLMLIEAPKWRDKIATVLGSAGRQGAMDSIGVIAAKLRRYLLARTILGFATAVLYVAWLWIFGVDLLLVWWLLAVLLNFISTIGSMVAGSLPVAYALVQKDFETALAVAAGLLVIEQVMGNYVDPRVQGRQVALSSLVVLVTLLVWGWIWGIAGAVLAVPITIAAMIVCAHVEPLRPFALMLSDASDMDELDRQTHQG